MDFRRGLAKGFDDALRNREWWAIAFVVLFFLFLLTIPLIIFFLKMH